MHFRILGSLVVLTDNGPKVPTAPKQQQTLALLLVHANRFVPTTALLRELWGDLPPRTSAATLQTYISQIRRFIAQEAGLELAEVMDRVLTTRPGGYTLRVEPEALDLHRFDAQVSAGRTALHAGVLEVAAERFREALGVWQGTALENVQHGPVLEVQVRRLEQLWLAITEQRYDLDLRLGRHHEVLGDLTELTEQHPFHENLHALLIKAFQQSGRRADALRVYHLLRRRLAEELGLDPSPEMAELQQSILRRPRPPRVAPAPDARRVGSPVR